MTDGKSDPFDITRSLLSLRLIEAIDRDMPRSEWLLRVPTLQWTVIRGEISSRPASWIQYHPPQEFPPITELIFPQSFLGKVAQIPMLIQNGKADAIVLRGLSGSQRLQVMGAVARALDCGLMVFNSSRLVEPSQRGKPAESSSMDTVPGPLCTMTASLPVFTYDLGPGETVTLPRQIGYSRPVMVILGLDGGLRDSELQKAVTLTLPALKEAHRRRHWQEALAGYQIDDLATIGQLFHFPGGYIRQTASLAIAHAALEGRDVIHLDEIREASRALNRQMLDTLADRLEVQESWDRLIVSDAASAKLREVEQRSRHRETLVDRFGDSANRGVRSLFTGPSGTGKTLAAKVLAGELGKDIYRVDLAAVVNKYIGETEKNLHRVLSTAEATDVILLLDEGDALLGTRTEVKSANDRYANLETNYLLQRLENYQGIVVVTTNLGESIDSAFLRRMDVVVSFLLPQARERLQIWRLHLPVNHAVDDVYLEKVAAQCAMTGGQIRNAALLATLLALDDQDSVISNRHLEQAIESEYRKTGAIFPFRENDQTAAANGGMEAFLDALLFN